MLIFSSAGGRRWNRAGSSEPSLPLVQARGGPDLADHPPAIAKREESGGGDLGGEEELVESRLRGQAQVPAGWRCVRVPVLAPSPRQVHAHARVALRSSGALPRLPDRRPRPILPVMRRPPGRSYCGCSAHRPSRGAIELFHHTGRDSSSAQALFRGTPAGTILPWSRSPRWLGSSDPPPSLSPPDPIDVGFVLLYTEASAGCAGEVGGRSSRGDGQWSSRPHRDRGISASP